MKRLTYDQKKTRFLNAHTKGRKMKSWKTTLAAIALLMIAVGTALSAGMDAGWDQIEWTPILAALFGAGGLFAARDNDKSSEDVNVK